MALSTPQTQICCGAKFTLSVDEEGKVFQVRRLCAGKLVVLSTVLSFPSMVFRFLMRCAFFTLCAVVGYGRG